MAKMESFDVIMRIDMECTDGMQVVAHAKKLQELIRCEDCIFRDDDGICDVGDYYVTPNDFCSKAMKDETEED